MASGHLSLLFASSGLTLWLPSRFVVPVSHPATPLLAVLTTGF